MPADVQVRSVSRTFDLLNLFDHRRPWLPLREIVERSGLPKTTVVRLLTTLESNTLVSARADGTYTLGAGMLRWVRTAESMWDVSEETRARMRGLVDSFGETVNVYVRHRHHRMSIAQEEGTHTVRNVVEVGVSMPLWAGATAKVLLSGAPADVIDELGAIRSDLDRERLTSEVEAARAAGYAVSDGEREQGATAVSAPIHARDGRVIAALSVSGPSPRLTGRRLEEGIRLVVDTAAAISTTGLGAVEEML